MSNKQGKELLAETGVKLGILDSLLIGIFGRRQDVAREVITAKFGDTDFTEHPFGQPIFRPDIEDRRISEVKELAERVGINPNLAATIEYLLIDESCKYQAYLLQSGKILLEPPSIEEMRQNLLALTSEVAGSYEGGYDKHYPATRQYVLFEAKTAIDQIQTLPSHLSALDLGCATGPFTKILASRFEKVTAVDVSPEMCAVATAELGHQPNVKVMNADFESEEFWSSLGTERFNFITLTLGTASDVVNLDRLLTNIEKHLSNEGKVLLSFYNKEALVYSAGFLPWKPSLAAILDPDFSTVTVKEEYILHARGYTISELRDRAYGNMYVSGTTSYPTLLPVFPPELLANETTLSTICEMEQSNSHKGAYIILTLSK